MGKIFKSRLVLIGLAISVLFGTSGCGDQYKMESLVWHADQAAKPILINEGAVPSYEFNQVLKQYRKIIDLEPGSSYAADAKFKIARLYIANGSFDLARSEYDAIIIAYCENKELVANALFFKAQSYEQENKWPEALKLFDRIKQDYAKTPQALSVPIYIARYYMKNDDTVEAVKAYQSAIEYYQKISDTYPDSKASLLSENMIVRAYMEMSSWNDALDYIQKMDVKYKLGPETLIVMAQIYKDKLNDPVKAQEIYDRILRDFPDTKIAKNIKQQMAIAKEAAKPQGERQ